MKVRARHSALLKNHYPTLYIDKSYLLITIYFS